MKKDEFEKEFERIGIEQKHADEAFAWLREHGKQGVHDIFYYRNRPKEKSAWAVQDKEKNRYYMRWMGKFVYLFACRDKGEPVGEPPFNEGWDSNEVVQDMTRENSKTIFKNLGIKIVRYSKSGEEIALPIKADKKLSSDEMNILEQFKQIIFYGPPGTGKTYSAKLLLAELFNFPKNDDGLRELQEWQGDEGYWNIIQFHPSYNYEDFVRGIKVETAESDGKSHVAYKTVNRIFGEMCHIAADDPDEDYVLIIDEINRANVSAVLGELIYALEYRGEPVNAPYEVNGKQEIVVPENLYIIGTMNSADRTIGQIDYAVRRRFAFLHCPPDRSVIKNEEALEFFDDVMLFFDNDISQDYDAADVRIGHSYFLASGIKLANKIIYQVVPILREYVKDGVLKKDVESKINEIERRAKKLLAGESENSDSEAEYLSESETEGNRIFHWKHTSGRSGGPGGVGRTVFNVIKDFIESHPDMNAEELEKEFDAIRKGCVRRRETINKESADSIEDVFKERFFNKDPIELKNGETVYVHRGWGARGNDERNWIALNNHMNQYGYTITEK